eukprot:TRINITY_DN82_c0_g1_i1.p2 TRINITY_DN82_c0_g1~~TRINITY_DN82_c0_g1_i1.p2  ORF type:complete len:183 (+),score=53.55 TRINITY_DN82_c0_g1_i1:99-647(+)
MNATKSFTATGTGVSRGKGDVWHPYVNDPSYTQRFLEIVSFLIIIVSVPAFLGGIYSIFVMGYGTALGLMGMHAWTRRHAVLFSISSLVFTLYLIVAIILNAIDRVRKDVPFYQDTNVGGTNYASGRYYGSRIFAYINHGILIVLSLVALIAALKIAGERRPEPGTLVHQTTTSTSHVPQSV